MAFQGENIHRIIKFMIYCKFIRHTTFNEIGGMRLRMLLIVKKIMKIKRMYLGFTFLFIYTCMRGKGVCGIKFYSWTIQATKNPVAATARKQKAKC